MRSRLSYRVSGPGVSDRGASDPGRRGEAHSGLVVTLALLALAAAAWPAIQRGLESAWAFLSSLGELATWCRLLGFPTQL